MSARRQSTTRSLERPRSIRNQESPPSSVQQRAGHRRRNRRGPVLPAGRLLHRSVAPGRSRGDHARALPRRGAVGRRAARAARGEIACTLAYGEAIEHNGVRVSLHPAGHVLGSAQVRLEHRGRVWVASGDYFVSGVEHDERHLRAVRAGALRLLHHRIDLRPADLPLAAAGRGVRRDRRLVARQRRRPAAPACCSATASARRSACCRASTRRSGRSSCTARSSR